MEAKPSYALNKEEIDQINPSNAFNINIGTNS